MLVKFCSIQIFLVVLLAPWASSKLVSGDESHENDGMIGKNISTQEKFIWTDINHSVSILCETPGALEISQCFLTQSSFNSPRKPILNVSLTETSNRYIPGLTPYGNGLQNGECGVTIKNVSQIDFGFWNCSLIAASQHFEVSVRVNQWVRPPFIPVIQDDVLKELLDLTPPSAANNVRNLTCCAQNGVPDLSLHFEIGNKRIQNEDNTIRNYTTRDNRVCIQWMNATLLARYNREKLICGAEHISLPKGELLRDSVDLNIQYDPRLRNLSNGTTIIIFVAKKTAIWNLTVTVEGNPAPILNLTLLLKNGSTIPLEKSPLEPNTLFLVSKQRASYPLEIETKLQIFDVQQLLENNIALRFEATNIHGRAFIDFRFEIDNIGSLATLSIVLGLALALIVTAAISVALTLRSNSQTPTASSDVIEWTRYRPSKEKAQSSEVAPEEVPCIPAQANPRGADDSNTRLKSMETPV